MSRLTRQEREKRVARDDGNPDDIVYSSGRYHNRSYHDDPDCHRLKGCAERERKRRVAKQQHAPCVVCVLDEKGNGHNQGGISKLERLLRDDKEDPEVFGGAD